MKRGLAATLLLAATYAGAVCAAESPVVPVLSGPVVDAAGVLSSAARVRLRQISDTVRASSGAELAVLTVPTVEPFDAFDYGMTVLEQWQLGRAGRDDGLLLLIVVEDREVRFFPGYGLEGILPDGLLGAILDKEVVPALARGDYDRAAVAGIAAVAARIEARASAVGLSPDVRGRRGLDPIIIALLLFVVLVIVVIIAQTAPARHGRRPRSVFWDGYPHGFGSGGFGRGGFGGGGFGSGGRFGGGGAGRRW